MWLDQLNSNSKSNSLMRNRLFGIADNFSLIQRDSSKRHFVLHHHAALLITRYFPEHQGFYLGLNYFNWFKPYLYVYILCNPVFLVNFVSFPYIFHIPCICQAHIHFKLHIYFYTRARTSAAGYLPSPW